MSDSIVAGKKRPPIEPSSMESELVEKRAKPANAEGGIMDLPISIRKLRLEAIFHPKFENENRSDKAVRRDMMNLVTKQQGYLEVTLKHSGSLVLWSGHTRYYSKNSVDNQYTYAAEILLRQHFERAWRQKSGDHPNEGILGKEKYDECSRFMKDNRLTLAFEVVTAVLGDHGDRPRMDYTILTAIADRSAERFYTTTEVIEFAQRFRVPHNDTWMFSSPASVTHLFQMYDATRENGTARDTVKRLSDAAEVTVSSMYQHEEFQGEILEGIIIRYVAYNENQNIDLTKILMERLSSKANAILEDVPAGLPLSFKINFEEEESGSAFFAANLRQISKDCGGFSTKDSGENKFQDSLFEVLSNGSSRPIFRKHSDKSIDLPAMTKHLTTASNDGETSRIAKLLQEVGKLNKPVSYALVNEESPDGQSRWLCIVHVHNDETFRQYHLKKDDDGMNLFRGFCIEIGGTSSTNESEGRRTEDTQLSKRSQGDFLMLKMKFLPYMTRTFLCRNNLRTLEKEGPYKFSRLIENLLNKWGISTESKKKLIPFLQSWAVFAHSALNSVGEDGSRLSQSNYLSYVEEFTKLYKEGKAPKPIKPKYEGIVIIVAPAQDDAERAATAIAQKLEVDAKPLTPENTHHGNVCYFSIFNLVSKSIKKKIGQMADCLSIVLLGFGAEDLNAKVEEEKHRERALGFAKSWRKYDCVELIDLCLKDSQSSMDGANLTDGFKSCLSQLKSAVERDTDERNRGLLVFFPGLPGCGKSTIAKAMDTKAKGMLSESEENPSRKLNILEGDAVGKSFWSQLKKIRRSDSRCVMIADKNTPPNALKLIGLNSYETNGIPIAVIPDAAALETTHVKGTTFPDGEHSSETSHFYPFSLSYLAVCMSRVLQRPPKSHRGKLDKSTPNACMILILFFSLYRSISAEAFCANIDSRLSSGGANPSLEPIVVPFLRSAVARPLPDDLQSELIAAIRLQRGYDLRKKKAKATDALVLDMEKRLRDVIEKYRDFLSKLTVEVSDSESSFHEQLASRICSLDTGTKEDQYLKLASIDLEKKSVHQILLDNSSTVTADFLEIALKGSMKDCAIQDGCYAGSQFARIPHITLMHHNDFGQDEMKANLAHLQGCFVNVSIKAFLWSERVAAFAADVEETTVDGQPLLRSQNSFVHITVWFAEGEKAILSNELPELVAQNKARRLAFTTPVTLKGKLTFWSMTNTPIIV